VARNVDIDVHGRIFPDDEARRALADRAGRFSVLPSAPDLLVLARRPAAGGSSPGPRCVLAGDLAAFPIADFLAFIHQARLSGLLTVAIGAVERAISFKAGEVRGARSSAVTERIGEVALRLGYVGREALAELEAGGGRLLGAALVESGRLSGTELRRCLNEQVTTVFHAILLAREGIFHLLDEGELETAGVPLSVDTQSLLMDGIRRIDEMSLFVARIPGGHAFLRRREPPRAVTLQPAEARLLDLVDGRRRVSDVAQAARLSEFDATKILYHLAEAGYVEAVAAPAREPGDADLGSLARGANAALREVAIAAARAGALEPVLAAGRGFLAAADRFAPLFRRVPLGADGTVDEATLLGNAGALGGAALRALEPTGDAARYLRDGLRELLFHQLFAAGERLDREADEALAAAVKRRIEPLGGLA
jgi:hypothetical protein